MQAEQAKPRRAWGPPIAGAVIAVTALGLDTLSSITHALPVHWIPVLGVSAGLILACWPPALRLLLRRERKHRWRTGALALLPPAALAGYALWTPALICTVPSPPMAFLSGGLRHLAYEIRIRHYGFRDLHLTEARVLGEDGSLLRTFDADWLVNGPFRGEEGRQQSITLPAGRDATLFLWLALRQDEPLPDRLGHVLVLAASGQDEAMPALGPSTYRRRRPRLPVIQSPLSGGPWLARAGPSNWSRHRRARVLGHISQRFAIDWVRIDREGSLLRRPTADGQDAANTDYLSYAAQVRSAFSGVVAEVRDGWPDNPPGKLLQPSNLSNFAGNYVAVRHDLGFCAFYGHLKQDSVAVRAGEKIFAGRLLGQIGNSGNSDDPHLHFQVADDCDPLISEGLPYHFEGYLSHGYLPWEREGGFSLPAGQAVEYGLPLHNEIVTFPPREDAVR